MELRVLNYFLVVAEEGNITTAAARLHISQPTLSRQLKELERELGQQLFERQYHGIRLTEEGQLLRVYAKQMVDLSAKVERDFATLHAKPFGDVYIGGIDAYSDMSAILMKRALAEHPEIVFHYHSCSSSEALTMLDRGLIDFAIVSQQVSITHYASLALADDFLWSAYMRSDNPLAQKTSIRLEDLRHEPLLMYEQALKAAPERSNLAVWFGGDLSNLNIVAASNLSSALVSFARHGLGTLITWQELTSQNMAGMRMIPLDPPVTTWGSVVWHKDRDLSPAAAYMLEITRSYVEEYRQSLK